MELVHASRGCSLDSLFSNDDDDDDDDDDGRPWKAFPGKAACNNSVPPVGFKSDPFVHIDVDMSLKDSNY
jgi:hypothetical protein